MLWWGSLPFHWGLYLITATTFGLVAAALGLGGDPGLVVLGLVGGLGGALLAVGSAVLLYLRARDYGLRALASSIDNFPARLADG